MTSISLITSTVESESLLTNVEQFSVSNFTWNVDCSDDFHRFDDLDFLDDRHVFDNFNNPRVLFISDWRLLNFKSESRNG